MALANRIADIVAPERCFGGFDQPPIWQLQHLAQLAQIPLDDASLVFDDHHAYIFTVQCLGIAETIRIRHPTDWFPPSVFIAYLNAKLADRGSDERLVAANDPEEETVALCTPGELAELRACIFARIDDLRWPAARRSSLELELLAAIREHANDDGPRLVYADWLIEREDPRGHFIMLQCHRDPAMHERAAALLLHHEPTWTCHLPGWARHPAFARGFVSAVTNERGARVHLTADGQLP